MVESYTIAELAEKLGISTTAIYKKVSREQFQTVKEKVGSREITFVKLTNEQLNQLIQDTQANRQFGKVGLKPLNEQFENEGSSYKQVENQSDYVQLAQKSLEISERVSNQFETITKQLVEYAEKAGQVKLLTDNLYQEKQDLKFYQDEYFKFKFENEQLIKVNIELKSINDNNQEELITIKKENQELKLQLEEERNKPFWKKKVL